MKITRTELQGLIKEEYTKMVEASKLQKRLQEINQELKSLNEGMEEEVAAEGAVGEVTKAGETSGKEWYEKNTPVAKFEKLKSKVGEPTATVKEDGGEEDAFEVGEEVKGEIETLASELGKAIDKKLSGIEAHEAAEEMDKDSEVVDSSEELDSAIEAGAGAEEEKEEIPTMEVKKEEVKEEGAVEEVKAEGVVEEVKEVKEEGVSKEAKPLNESAIGKAKVTNKVLSEELNRMRVLAKLDRSEE